MTPPGSALNNAPRTLENNSAKFDAREAEGYCGQFRIWPVNQSVFSTHSMSLIRHNFHEHPLMEMAQLLSLAKELQPIAGCRFLDPTATESSNFHHESTSYQGLALEEVFRRIHEPGSWIALYNIENVPRYRRFLKEALSSVRPLVERDKSKILMATGFIFLSAPPSITPFHIDRENNFWLQIRGRKVIRLWDRDDQRTVSASAKESFIVDRNSDGIRLTESNGPLGRDFDSGPGDGMYFPSTTPHMTRTTTDWVTAANGVSISIGVNFYTNVTLRHSRVHQVNRILRRTGLKPLPPGQQAWRDMIKAPFGRIVVSMLKIRRKDYVVPPGGA